VSTVELLLAAIPLFSNLTPQQRTNLATKWKFSKVSLLWLETYYEPVAING
jgi:hypothetical protein